MASESCSICGEEADADEIDPHGHFSEDDEGELNEDVVVHPTIAGNEARTWSPTMRSIS
jgi:hypothetical protein